MPNNYLAAGQDPVPYGNSHSYYYSSEHVPMTHLPLPHNKRTPDSGQNRENYRVLEHVQTAQHTRTPDSDQKGEKNKDFLHTLTPEPKFSNLSPVDNSPSLNTPALLPSIGAHNYIDERQQLPMPDELPPLPMLTPQNIEYGLEQKHNYSPKKHKPTPPPRFSPSISTGKNTRNDNQYQPEGSQVSNGKETEVSNEKETEVSNEKETEVSIEKETEVSHEKETEVSYEKETHSREKQHEQDDAGRNSTHFIVPGRPVSHIKQSLKSIANTGHLTGGSKFRSAKSKPATSGKSKTPITSSVSHSGELLS